MWKRLSILLIGLVGSSIAALTYMHLQAPSIRLLWTSPLRPRMQIEEAVSIGGDTILVWGENLQPTLLLLNGTVVWSYQLQSREQVLACRDLAGKSLIGTTNNRLLCIDSGGKTSWKLDLSQYIGIGLLPNIGSDGNIYATYSEPGICKVSPEGRLIWRKGIEDLADGMPFAIDGNGIYLTDSTTLGVMIVDLDGNVVARNKSDIAFGFQPASYRDQVTFLEINQGTITTLDTSTARERHKTSMRWFPGTKEAINKHGYLLTVEQQPDEFNVRDPQLKVVATYACSANESPMYSTHTVDSLDRFWIMRAELSKTPELIRKLPASSQKWFRSRLRRRSSARLQLLDKTGKQIAITRVRPKLRWVYPVPLNDGTVVFLGRDQMYCYGFGK